MKKSNFNQLALMGLAGGLLLSSSLSAETTSSDKKAPSTADANQKHSQVSEDPNDGNLGYHDMTEEELLLELNDEGTKLYNSLTPEGKELARKVASQRCNQTNACKGLNACKTEKNNCAGKGKCKGQSKCAFSDKNLAVKVVSDKMNQKRADAVK